MLLSVASSDDCVCGGERHEQQSIAAALATFTHHPVLRGQKTSRSERRGMRTSTTRHGDRRPPPQPELFDLSVDEEPGGVRRDRLAGVRPQERIQRNTVEQFDDSAPDVPSLDGLVLWLSSWWTSSPSWRSTRRRLTGSRTCLRGFPCQHC